MTLPLILTLERATESDSEKLLALLQDSDMRQRSFREVFDIIEKYDGFIRTKAKAKECIARAVTCLDMFSIGKKQDVAALKGLAYYSLERDK